MKKISHHYTTHAITQLHRIIQPTHMTNTRQNTRKEGSHWQQKPNLKRGFRASELTVPSSYCPYTHDIVTKSPSQDLLCHSLENKISLVRSPSPVVVVFLFLFLLLIQCQVTAVSGDRWRPPGHPPGSPLGHRQDSARPVLFTVESWMLELSEPEWVTSTFSAACWRKLLSLTPDPWPPEVHSYCPDPYVTGARTLS